MAGPTAAKVQRLMEPLRSRCESGDLAALSQLAELACTYDLALPLWANQPLSDLVEAVLQKPKVIGRGPRATVEANARRDWIDLRRSLAVERFESVGRQGDKRPSLKWAIGQASDFLATTDASGTVDQFKQSRRRVLAKGARKFSMAPSDAALGDFTDALLSAE